MLLFPGVLAMTLLAAAGARAVLPFHFGFYPPGPLDGITDVPGVRVGHLTKIEGSDIRTGATAVLPNADPWDRKVSAAFFAFNGNGEMTGTHWIEESGYLEEPVVLTSTLDVGRAADGVVSWVIEHHPAVGRGDDVPSRSLPSATTGCSTTSKLAPSRRTTSWVCSIRPHRASSLGAASAPALA